MLPATVITAREMVEAIVAASLRDLARSHRFRKKALTFHRRVGDVQQFVNVQLSQGNVGSSGRFYINVGIGFDGLWRLAGDADDEPRKYYECHYSQRIRHLVPGAPDQWDIDARTNVSAVAEGLRALAGRLFDKLDAIDSPAGMIASGLLQHGMDVALRGSLRYLLDDLPGALADLRAASADFPVGPATTVGFFVKTRRLAKLLPLIEGDKR